MADQRLLDTVAAFFQNKACTEQTMANKDSYWRIFMDFCDRFHENPVPADGRLLVRFSVFLVIERNCSVPTVKNYLSAVRRIQKQFWNIDVPTPSEFLPLKDTLKGAAKFLGRTVKQKFPVTAHIHSVLVHTIPKNSPFKALYNLLFFGLPRLGNVVPYPNKRFSHIKHLTWEKVLFCQDGVIVSFWVTKTIQCFERELRVPISESPLRPAFCLKNSLRQLLQIPGYPRSPKSPVFNVFKQGVWRPMHRLDVTKFMSRQLNFLGLDSKKITPSGFRKGGLSHGLLCIGNIELLRVQGDWASDCYKRYIRIPAEMRFSVTQEALQAMPV